MPAALFAAATILYRPYYRERFDVAGLAIENARLTRTVAKEAAQRERIQARTGDCQGRTRTLIANARSASPWLHDFRFVPSGAIYRRRLL